VTNGSGDALDELAQQLYGREPRSSEYAGGRNARILRDAAAEIRKLRAKIVRIEDEANQGGFSF
tara:strand:- start:1127 stop:1318 length:192 start_codon:yes stop_codon:yes gene_type:complete